MSLIFLVQSDLNEQQRERFVSSMNICQIAMPQYTYLQVKQLFLELVCVSRTGVADPNIAHRKRSTFYIIEEGETEEGEHGFWVIDEEIGEEGFTGLYTENEFGVLGANGSYSKRRLHGRSRKENRRAMARNEKDQAPASARGQKVKVMQHGTMTGKTQLSGEKDPGQTAKPTTWFKPADFSEDGKRLAQADLLEGLNIASVFIRQHVHFALDHCLTTMTDALRPESDCIIAGAPECLEGLEPVITENKYVLTVYSVPYTRFVGFWAPVDCAWHWIDPPKPGEPAKMTNYKSDVDISMHTAYHIHHVTSKLSDSTAIGNFLNSFQTVRDRTGQTDSRRTNSERRISRSI